MNIYILIILALVLILFLGKIKSSRTIYMKKLVIPLLCTLFILCLIMFSHTAVSSALKGINLWLGIVFPSLFPFFVASELLNRTGFVKAVGVLLEPIMRPLFNVPGCASFAFAMGITSGYPVGAKITAGMREDKSLTKPEAERLLAFSNNSGPLFIIGAVAVGMFSMPKIGLFLLGCHIVSCITVGVLFGIYSRRKSPVNYRSSVNLWARFKSELLKNPKNPHQGFGIIFGEAIRDSVATMLAIGGFIIFFSVIINLLIETGIIGCISNSASIFLAPLGIHKEIVTSIISGFFEITTGTNMASRALAGNAPGGIAVGAPLIQQLTAASMIIGWAGLSVHSQVLSIISKTDISIKPYLLGKFLQGVFAAGYTFIGIKIAGPLFIEAKPAFSSSYILKPLQWNDYLFTSCEYLVTTLAVLGIGIVISVIFNTLKQKLF